MAFRYLRARRKQTFISVVTLISVLGVASGVMALNIALALNAGMQKEFRDRILGATSHVTLFKIDQGPIADYEPLVSRTRRLEKVLNASPTIYGPALLVSDLREKPAILKGVDLAQKERFSELLPRIIEGSSERFGESQGVPAIILGKDLARSLGVLEGDNLRAMGLGGELSPVGRMPRISHFRLIAIFDSGLWEYDSNWALIPLPAAQRFFGFASDEVLALEYRVEDIYQAEEVAGQIEQIAGDGHTANTWIQLNRPLFSALEFEKLAMFVAIGLIVLVASLNIVSTLTLMVMEKNRDIAIITAMGGTPRTVMAVFMLQGLIIGLIGTVLGDLLGSIAAWYCDKYRVFPLEPQVYVIPYVPFELSVGDILVVSLVAILISFIATIYPARAASRLDPVEALRYE